MIIILIVVVVVVEMNADICMKWSEGTNAANPKKEYKQVLTVKPSQIFNVKQHNQEHLKKF